MQEEIQAPSLGPDNPLQEGVAACAFLRGESHAQRSLPGYRVAKSQTRLK